MGRFKTAFKVVSDTLAKDPENWVKLACLSSKSLSECILESFIIFYFKLLTPVQKKYFTLAEIKENQGDYASSKKYLEKAKEFQENRQIEVKLAKLQNSMGNHDGAVEGLQKFADQ